MALRAGYYGLKNSVKRTLEKLAADMAGAKIIKSVGAGLNLSDQGALTTDIDSETMEFKNGKIASKSSGGGISYSEIEQNTGKKWIDGSDIYCITHLYPNLFAPSESFWKDTGVVLPDAAQIVWSQTWGDDGSNHPNRADRSGTTCYGLNRSTNGLDVFTRMGGSISGFYIEYTKISS